MNSRSAIAWLLRPVEISRRISISRGVRPFRSSAAAGGAAGSASGRRARARARASSEAGAERRQIVDGAPRLRDAASGRPSAPHHPRELHARATGLEWRAALLEQIDRIFEMLSCATSDRRSRATSSRRRGWPAPRSGPVPRFVGDRCELGDRVRRFIARGPARRRRGPSAPAPPRARSGSSPAAGAGAARRDRRRS